MKKNRLQKKLNTCKQEYEQIKATIYDVGFIVEGSISRVYTRCGKKKCRCNENKELRHGPYYQLTWKKKGKTISRFLSNEMANLFKEWAENRNKLNLIVKKMNEISSTATQCICELNSLNDPRSKSRKSR